MAHLFILIEFPCFTNSFASFRCSSNSSEGTKIIPGLVVLGKRLKYESVDKTHFNSAIWGMFGIAFHSSNSRDFETTVTPRLQLPFKAQFIVFIKLPLDIVNCCSHPALRLFD